MTSRAGLLGRVPTPQKDLRDVAGAVRTFLAARHDLDTVRQSLDAGEEPDVWGAACAQLGLGGLLVDEEHGGSGLGVDALVAVGQEAGRAVLAGPALPTTVFAAVLLGELVGDAADDADAGEVDRDTCVGLLTGIADGSIALAACAVPVAGADPGADVVVTLDGATSARVDGLLSPVLGGRRDPLLVTAPGPSGLMFLLVEPGHGVDRDRRPTIDPTRIFTRVGLHGARARVLATGAAVLRARRVAEASSQLWLAAESVGAASLALDDAVAYAKVREQFDRPIGSFQALAHTCADLLVDVETARTSLLAAQAPGVDEPLLSLLARAAAVVAGPAARHVTEESLHLHGGLGFTWEHPGHLLHRRTLTNEVLGGSTHQQLLALWADLGESFATTPHLEDA